MDEYRETSSSAPGYICTVNEVPHAVSRAVCDNSEWPTQLDHWVGRHFIDKDDNVLFNSIKKRLVMDFIYDLATGFVIRK